MHEYTHMYVCMCVYKCMYVRMHEYTRICIYIYMCVRMYVPIYVCSELRKHSQLYARTKNSLKGRKLPANISRAAKSQDVTIKLASYTQLVYKTR